MALPAQGGHFINFENLRLTFLLVAFLLLGWLYVMVNIHSWVFDERTRVRVPCVCAFISWTILEPYETLPNTEYLILYRRKVHEL